MESVKVALDWYSGDSDAGVHGDASSELVRMSENYVEIETFRGEEAHLCRRASQDVSAVLLVSISLCLPRP